MKAKEKKKNICFAARKVCWRSSRDILSASVRNRLKVDLMKISQNGVAVKCLT